MSSSAGAPYIIYVGMDGHKDSLTLAVIPAAAKHPTRLERLPNEGVMRLDEQDARSRAEDAPASDESNS